MFSTSLRGLALCGLLSSPSLGNPEVFTCSLDVQGYELWFWLGTGKPSLESFRSGWQHCLRMDRSWWA